MVTEMCKATTQQVTKRVNCGGACVRQSVMVTKCGMYVLMKQATYRKGREGVSTDKACEECLGFSRARM